MPSLADIPPKLLDKDKREEFVHWLRDIPVDISTRRGLIRIWSTVTGEKLTAEQFNFISRTALT